MVWVHVSEYMASVSVKFAAAVHQVFKGDGRGAVWEIVGVSVELMDRTLERTTWSLLDAFAGKLTALWVGIDVLT